MSKWFATFTVVLAFSSGVVSFSAVGETYRVSQGSHPLDAYAAGVLRLAVEALGEGDKVQVKEQQYTQARVAEELLAGQLDVMWLASNQQAEEELLPVRFPMLKGLLGYRICIISPQRQARFSAVRTLSDLRELTFGQGLGWPDVEILRSNDLQVITTAKYENLFHMTDGGRFDGFPRGVLEPWVEIESHPDLELTVDKHILLIYGLPFYFFVDPKRPSLAEKIHRGLDLALATGEFDRYFFNHPMVKNALQNANLSERRTFHLDNPWLPKIIPTDRPEYWFNMQ